MQRRTCTGLSSLLIALLAGCSSTGTYPNGQLEYQGQVDLGRDQVGEWTYWHENGQLECQGPFDEDRQVGQWTYWYDNGNEEMSGRFEDHRREGPWRYWYRNGQRRAVGSFRRGREHGTWTFFTSDGTPSHAGEYADGQQTLRWLSWHADGTPRSEGSFHRGVRIGPWRTWDEDGAVTEVTHPLPPGLAIVREAWPDGSTRREGLLQDGRPIGRWVTWHADGARRLAGDMVDGRPGGIWEAYDAAGTCIARGAVDDGRPTGEWSGEVGGVEQRWTPDPQVRSMPFTGEWSQASLVDVLSPEQVVDAWLAEVASPDFGDAVVRHDPGAAAAAAPMALTLADRPVVPVRAQPWTVRERQDLEKYERNYGMDPPPPGERSSGLYDGAPRPAEREPEGDRARSDPLVGRELPVTRFPCADGSELDLADLKGRQVLVVILRGYGGQVCVYCVAQTGALEDARDAFERSDTEVVVVFPGPRGCLEAFLSAYRITFKNRPKPSYRMVFDPDLTLVEQLDISADLALPTSFLLDERGTISACYVGKNIEDRPPVRYWIDKLGATSPTP